MELTVSTTRRLNPPAASPSAGTVVNRSSATRTATPGRNVAAVASRGRPLLAWPLAGPVTSGFGLRWGRIHCGIDIGSPAGTPVGAAAAGVVKRVAWIVGYGYTVEIDHGGGVTTFYAHLSRAAVQPGQEVEKGQMVGRVGETGRTTGPHLHFELRLDGEPVDPLPYLTR
jgi:murein DD-endopeptidase MepM/ murein hydrolase activator NlpD